MDLICLSFECSLPGFLGHPQATLAQPPQFIGLPLMGFSAPGPIFCGRRSCRRAIGKLIGVDEAASFSLTRFVHLTAPADIVAATEILFLPYPAVLSGISACRPSRLRLRLHLFFQVPRRRQPRHRDNDDMWDLDPDGIADTTYMLLPASCECHRSSIDATPLNRGRISRCNISTLRCDSRSAAWDRRTMYEGLCSAQGRNRGIAIYGPT